MPKPTLYVYAIARITFRDDTTYHGRQPLPYRADDNEFARFVMPQIKRKSNVFPIMSVPPSPLEELRLDSAKIIKTIKETVDIPLFSLQ